MSELSRMAKVNENGVLEVPKEVMDKLGLKAGDNVSVVERSGHKTWCPRCTVSVTSAWPRSKMAVS